MNISVSPEMEMIIQQKISGGFYNSPADVVKAGLKLLEKYDEAKFQELRDDILAAHEQSQRGESTPLEIENIIAAGRARLEQKERSSE